MQNTQEEHDEEDQQKDYEARSRKPLHWSHTKKKPGFAQDEGIKKRFPLGKVSCALNGGNWILIVCFSV